MITAVEHFPRNGHTLLRRDGSEVTCLLLQGECLASHRHCTGELTPQHGLIWDDGAGQSEMQHSEGSRERAQGYLGRTAALTKGPSS